MAPAFPLLGGIRKRIWMPGWLLFKEPNLLYVVNSIGFDTSLFKLSDHKLNLISSATASEGGVDLEFIHDKTRMVEACYRSGMIDIWDTSKADGTLKYMKSLSPPGKPTPPRNHHRPHQAVLDPTGRFFVVPNLGGDTLVVIDSEDDRYEITGCTTVPANVGPRRVAFIRRDEKLFLIMVGEVSNEVFLYETDYSNDTLQFNEIERQSTYGNSPPSNGSAAKVAELMVSNNQTDVYISNRVTGETTDHIAHFEFGELYMVHIFNT
ncbi:Lactonase, 7-bladed beta-propeller-domain-containing protein [Hypoxylon trugodes]|uniref:Lactonase, 7-bladed beta-propeller-domain-containing protein n=1 Tax=Hypoxylon trugodes TaxID=326681 RepID=UPI00219B2CB5|nr:Lactonase, 7-bladed beta-propeller-domain-containing protein [Hypoxylon trugodes]KAI1389366.1 Lactonase, 7-bladed beta-propeller-domain-containing protein [Hypoxylon trugodes]